MSSQRWHVILAYCKAFFQCMHVKLFVYIELTSLATSENTMLMLKGFFCTLKQKYHNFTKQLQQLYVFHLCILFMIKYGYHEQILYTFIIPCTIHAHNGFLPFCLRKGQWFMNKEALHLCLLC